MTNPLKQPALVELFRAGSVQRFINKPAGNKCALQVHINMEKGASRCLAGPAILAKSDEVAGQSKACLACLQAVLGPGKAAKIRRRVWQFSPFGIRIRASGKTSDDYGLLGAVA